MIYVYDTSRHEIASFPDAQTFTAVLATTSNLYLLNYNSLLERQKLSENDVYRDIRVHPEDGVYHTIEFSRDVIIYDEYDRLLDVRDFRPDPNIDYSKIYNAWREEQRQAILRERSKRQGKRHRKGYGKCRWERKANKATIPNSDLYDFDAKPRHFNRINNDGGKKPHIYTDCFVKTENNWKNNRKAKRQYMWHKPCHTDYMERNTK